MTEPVVAQRASGPLDAEYFLDTVGKTDELPSTDDVTARLLPLLE